MTVRKWTQREVVLSALRDAGDTGVHSFEFLSVGIPRAAARVQELRVDGHTITSTRECLNGNAQGVRYRLVEPPQVDEPVVDAAPADDMFDRLFPPPVPGHHEYGDAA